MKNFDDLTEVERFMHVDFVRRVQEKISNAQAAADQTEQMAKNVHSNTAHNLRVSEIHGRYAKELEDFLYSEVKHK